MPATAIAAEPIIRLGCFLGILMAIAFWEMVAPRRRQIISRLRRWPNNLAVVALDTLLVRVLLPLSGVALAFLAQGKGWGIVNLLSVSVWLSTLAGVLLLDLIIYGQHVAFHVVPILWRLHRMHHADLEVDVTTGLRFHPGEILLSTFVKLGSIVLLGTPPIAVLIFEVLLNATSLFNHGNVRLPRSVDRILRFIVVTPEMHRVHHSIIANETNSNFGFNVPWWDRLFGTYRAQPAMGHEGMTLGIDAFRDPCELRIDRMLLQPLRAAPPNTFDRASIS